MRRGNLSISLRGFKIHPGYASAIVKVKNLEEGAIEELSVIFQLEEGGSLRYLEVVLYDPRNVHLGTALLPLDVEDQGVPTWQLLEKVPPLLEPFIVAYKKAA